MHKQVSLLLSLLLVFCSALWTKPASADSLTLYNLGSDNVHVIGIDASGSVLLTQQFGCGGPNDPNSCYEEFTNGVLSYRSDSAPASFVPENGTPCAAPGGFTQSFHSTCDGNFEVTGGVLGTTRGVWETVGGASASGDPVFYGSGDQLFLNRAGDFAAVDGLQDTLYQAIAQTPEPSSLLLLATGCASLGGVARRRWRAAASRGAQG